MAKDTAWTITPNQTEPHHWVVTFGGCWKKTQRPPDHRAVLRQLDSQPASITLDAQSVTTYDSSFTALLLKLTRHFQHLNIPVQHTHLPGSVDRLLQLALSSEIRSRTEHIEPDNSLSYQAGVATLELAHGFGDMLGMIGASLRSVYEYLINKSRAPFKFVLNAMQVDGPDALGIVCLIGFLIGVTLAFIGALELQRFGASIYVADLVMVGMSRELAPLMTGVVMAGRSGAAIAASLASMRANEEVDALITMGINPINYLVSPRTVGLITMMPFLVAYAYILGNLGGGLVATSMLKLTLLEYITQARSAINFANVVIGLGKGVIFGYLIAIAGALRGLKASPSAQGVGQSTTSAVVTGIVLIIIANVITDLVLFAAGV